MAVTPEGKSTKSLSKEVTAVSACGMMERAEDRGGGRRPDLEPILQLWGWECGNS